MKVSFSCLDLREVQIPGADLSNAILDRANLSGANLESANLINASLNGTNMVNANLTSITLNMPKELLHEEDVLFSQVSPNNKYLVSRGMEYLYFWDLQNRTCKGRVKRKGQSRLGNLYDASSDYDEIKREEAIFTPDGRFFLIYNNKQDVEIYSLDSCKYVKSIKISDHQMLEVYFSFSLKGNCFISYGSSKNGSGNHESYLKIWEVKETEDTSLDMYVKNEYIVPYRILNVRFSKKFPFIYFIKEQLILRENKRKKLEVDLGIWSLEKASKIANIQGLYERDDFVANDERMYDYMSKMYSLDIFDSDNNDEDHLFIACDRNIYSIQIFKKLEKTQIEKFSINEIHHIYNLKIRSKTNELIYVCKSAICLYSIKDCRLIGKYKLYDIDIESLPISHDGINIYIHNLNKILMYPIETLKKSENSAHEIISRSCSSFWLKPNIRTITSINMNFDLEMYDIETGEMLNSIKLRKVESLMRNIVIESIVSLGDKLYITIFGSKLNRFRSYIINAENEEVCFEKPAIKVSLADNANYVACAFSSKRLSIYKMSPFPKCIQMVHFKNKMDFSHIAIAPDFQSIPRIALIKDEGRKIILYNIDSASKVLSKKQLSLGSDSREIICLKFIENSNRLIIASRYERDDGIILWDVEQNRIERYKIDLLNADVSQDGTLVIYSNKTNSSNVQLCLWSILEKRLLVTVYLANAVATPKLKISPDNKLIFAVTANGGIYVWKILEGTLRLLWRTSHNLQAKGLILDGNHLEKDVEDALIEEMGAIKL